MKYNIFDRECPFKEIWLNKEQRLKFIEYNKDKLERSKIGMKLYEKSHSKKQEK